ncbi:hypothetical protein [Thermosporothrix hazakensis]|uniref:hypothetical protein n=1 Tax=Thermosporothrix hazakensis TaxID=644383 RepID=UPI0010F75BB6|nr:hypothetical protein [Thermosporothrix hazakensis]
MDKKGAHMPFVATRHEWCRRALMADTPRGYHLAELSIKATRLVSIRARVARSILVRPIESPSFETDRDNRTENVLYP